VTDPHLSTEDYLRSPETVLPTEVIFGALRVAKAPTVRHQQALGGFYLALAHHVRERRLGRVLIAPLDVIFDWDRALILQPDLIFVSHARFSASAEATADRQVRGMGIVGAPDMVLEVLSPDPRIGELDERIGWFTQYGVREIWLLHQLEERLEILRAHEGRVSNRLSFGYTQPIRSDVFPQFSMALGDVLRE
jgi:Uma2 family endonuclease